MRDLFDEYYYIAYPLTTNVLSSEIKKITSDYQEKKLSNNDFILILQFYADNLSVDMFNEDKTGLQERLSTLIGKFRTSLLVAVYEDLGYIERSEDTAENNDKPEEVEGQINITDKIDKDDDFEN